MIWTLLKFLGLIILALVLYVLISIGSRIWAWYSSKPLYAHIPRHPLSAPAIVEMVDTTKGLGLVYPPVRNPDGTWIKVTNWGPYVDGRPYIMVADKDALRDIFSSKTAFPKAHVTYDIVADFLGDGLVISSGTLWASQRKLIQPFFHLASLKSLHDSMAESTKRFVKMISSKEGVFVPGKDFFSLHSSEVINKLAFGDKLDSQWIADKFKKFNVLLNLHFMGKLVFHSLWDYVPFFTVQSIKREITAKLIPLIKQRRQDQDDDQRDLLGFLSRARNDQGEPLPLQLIVDECITFLFAGTDTTAATLSWIFYYLSLYPEVQQKVQDEVDVMLDGEVPCYTDLPKLKYCHCVLNETLRIQPTVPLIERECAEDCTVAGYFLPKGTTVGLGIYQVHHDPTLWDDPDAFNPNRWINLERPAFTWTPFSAGHRNCIGSKFADNEIILAMAMILQQFSVSHNRNKDIIPVWEGVLTPLHLELKFTSRESTK